MNTVTAAMRLSFVTDQQEQVTIRIPRARLDATSQLVNLSMNEMVNTSSYDTRGRGNLQTPYAAQLVLTDSIHFNVTDL